VVEAQQRTLEANPGMSLNALNIDAGSVWARRLIDAMIASESR
jgi:vanillate O-demethylase monooxygenase subunit